VYAFDKIYSEHTDQKLIWQEAKLCFLKTLSEGCDNAIIAYG
jgi:hypothetical protein